MTTAGSLSQLLLQIRKQDDPALVKELTDLQTEYAGHYELMGNALRLKDCTPERAAEMVETNCRMQDRFSNLRCRAQALVTQLKKAASKASS